MHLYVHNIDVCFFLLPCIGLSLRLNITDIPTRCNPVFLLLYSSIPSDPLFNYQFQGTNEAPAPCSRLHRKSSVIMAAAAAAAVAAALEKSKTGKRK